MDLDLKKISQPIEQELDEFRVHFREAIRSKVALVDLVSKYILREAVKDILPPQIYGRFDKKGFETPSDEWFRVNPFKDYITELLNSSSFQNRGYFDVQDCKQKYQKHLERKANLSNEIWKWINLEIWFRKFIDK